MTTKTSQGFLGALALVALAIPLTLSLSSAQDSKVTTPSAGTQDQAQFGPGQPPGGGGQGFPQPPAGGPGQGRMQGPMMGGGGGGGAFMVADGAYLYILQGNRLFKVEKESLKVSKEGQLPRPQGMPGGPGPGGGPGGPPPGGGGGGQK